MANSSPQGPRGRDGRAERLFRVDGSLDGLVLHVRPWLDDTVDKVGFDPRSSYVEDYWLSILGPSTTWLLRRLAAGFEYSPDGFDLDLAEMSRSLGLGDRSGQHSPFVRSINRTVQFGLARVLGPEELSVRRRLPPLNRPQLLRLSPALQVRHALWRGEQLATPPEAGHRRAGQLALSLMELGEDNGSVERQLLRWRFSREVAEAALSWAQARGGGAVPGAGPLLSDDRLLEAGAVEVGERVTEHLDGTSRTDAVHRGPARSVSRVRGRSASSLAQDGLLSPRYRPSAGRGRDLERS